MSLYYVVCTQLATLFESKTNRSDLIGAVGFSHLLVGWGQTAHVDLAHPLMPDQAAGGAGHQLLLPSTQLALITGGGPARAVRAALPGSSFHIAGPPSRALL